MFNVEQCFFKDNSEWQDCVPSARIISTESLKTNLNAGWGVPVLFLSPPSWCPLETGYNFWTGCVLSSSAFRHWTMTVWMRLSRPWNNSWTLSSFRWLYYFHMTSLPVDHVHSVAVGRHWNSRYNTVASLTAMKAERNAFTLCACIWLGFPKCWYYYMTSWLEQLMQLHHLFLRIQMH